MSRTNYLLPLESLQPILSIPATKIQPDELFLTDSSIKATNTPAAFIVVFNQPCTLALFARACDFGG